MPEMSNLYEAEAQSRWPEQFAHSQRNWAALSADEQRAHLQFGTDTTKRLAELFIAGATASDAAVQEQIANHYRWVDLWWTPNREAYTGLGQMYVEDPRFAKNYEDLAVGLAQFMADAMSLYAREHLA